LNFTLQPLRVPAGWRIDWNTLAEIDPSETAVRDGWFGGSSLFLAIHDSRRTLIDLEWRPEDDPNGEYVLKVLHAPWERTPGGQQDHAGTEPVSYRNGVPVHEFRTRDRFALVAELESLLASDRGWVEGS
jgi:hypothetical protein